ncbi:MAG: DUF6775 family putative metallopeptidase [Methanobacteriota archaeon]
MKFQILLYSGSKLLSAREIERYLKEKLKKNVEERGEFLDRCLKSDPDEFAKVLASIRIIDVMKPFKYNEPLYGEIEYEKRVLKGIITPGGILYDGFMLQRIFYELLPKEEKNLKNVHIILIDRLLATFDEDDLRYHARVNILGCPSIISVSGIVEAPAKPREYYIEKRIGSNEELLKLKYRGRFIDYDDERLTEVAKGCVMQAIFYQIFGEAFCESKNCRLYNAHWQEELINAQLEDNFCERHEKMLQF